jgi:hypothetical protein
MRIRVGTPVIFTGSPVDAPPALETSLSQFSSGSGYAITATALRVTQQPRSHRRSCGRETSIVVPSSLFLLLQQ